VPILIHLSLTATMPGSLDSQVQRRITFRLVVHVGVLMACLLPGILLSKPVAGGTPVSEPHLRLVLVVPSGVTAPTRIGDDLRSMLASANAWLQREAGRQVRIRRDASGVALIDTLALDRSEASLLMAGDDLVAHLVDELETAYADSPDVVVFAYIGRVALRSRTHCGRRLGRHAGLFLANEGCRGHPFAGHDRQGWDKILLHELFHLLGAVPACAPNGDGARHVDDSPSDLMHRHGGGAVPRLDVGRDDYFGHGIEGCPDLAGSDLFY
jgi:hypothetical protein